MTPEKTTINGEYIFSTILRTKLRQTSRICQMHHDIAPWKHILAVTATMTEYYIEHLRHPPYFLAVSDFFSVSKC